MHVHVISYNIHKGFSAANRRFTLPAMRNALHVWCPDIVCLQEIQGQPRPRRRLPLGWPMESQVAYLAGDLFPFAAYGANALDDLGHHGNAILTRFPILSEVNVDLSLQGWERRGLLHTILQLPGSKQLLHVACTHLNLRARDRREQLKLIRSYLQSEVPPTEPLILAGDFNDWQRRAHTLLPDDVREVFLSLRGMPARTYPGALPILSLDRIYARHLHPVTADRLSFHPWAGLSDHGAISARLRLQGLGSQIQTPDPWRN